MMDEGSWYQVVDLVYGVWVGVDGPKAVFPIATIAMEKKDMIDCPLLIRSNGRG